jgi:hypothetical protein
MITLPKQLLCIKRKRQTAARCPFRVPFPTAVLLDDFSHPRSQPLEMNSDINLGKRDEVVHVVPHNLLQSLRLLPINSNQFDIVDRSFLELLLGDILPCVRKGPLRDQNDVAGTLEQHSRGRRAAQ